MKDYIAELEKKKKKQKTWTIIFVAAFILFSSLAIYYSGILRKEAIHEITTNEAIQQTENLLEATDSLGEAIGEAIYYSEKNDSTKDLEIQNLRDSLAALKELIKEIAKVPVNENSSRNDNVLQELPSVQQRKVNAIIDEKAIAALGTEKNEKYSVQIIYMDGFSRDARAAERALSNSYIIEKNEQMDQFSYNRSIRYFNPEDRTEGEKIRRLLDPNNTNNIELRPLKLEAPPKTIEVWIGSKSKESVDRVQSIPQTTRTVDAMNKRKIKAELKKLKRR